MKYGEDYSIDKQILSTENQRYTETFSCGNPEIDDYFRKRAAWDRTAVTYLYIDVESDKLIACFTISCSAIFTNNDEFESISQFSTILSAMEVKYVAVDEAYQHIPYRAGTNRPTLSDLMFDDMIWQMNCISHEQIGASKIVLYSVPNAINFYKRHGFKEFGDTMYGDEGYYVKGCEPLYFDLN